MMDDAPKERVSSEEESRLELRLLALETVEPRVMSDEVLVTMPPIPVGVV